MTKPKTLDQLRAEKERAETQLDVYKRQAIFSAFMTIWASMKTLTSSTIWPIC